MNHLREVLNAFLNWCVKTSRLVATPMAVVPKLAQDLDRRRERRALTVAELRELLLVAEKHGRKLWYLMALWGGLRRSELLRVTWGDVDLERGVLVVRWGKARRVDEVPLHPELLAALRKVKRSLSVVSNSDRIFPKEVTNLTRRRDFERAGIEHQDQFGKHADLHALRSTLATMLARNGVAPQVGRGILRHADYATTLKHYTKLELLDAKGAVDRLPSIEMLGAAGSRGEEAHQRNPQHSQHETTHSGATTCDDAQRESAVGDRGKPCPSASLCDKMRVGALVPPTRFERATFGLGNRRSIHLSYGGPNDHDPIGNRLTCERHLGRGGRAESDQPLRRRPSPLRAADAPWPASARRSPRPGSRPGSAGTAARAWAGRGCR